MGTHFNTVTWRRNTITGDFNTDTLNPVSPPSVYPALPPLGTLSVSLTSVHGRTARASLPTPCHQHWANSWRETAPTVWHAFPALVPLRSPSLQENNKRIRGSDLSFLDSQNKSAATVWPVCSAVMGAMFCLEHHPQRSKVRFANQANAPLVIFLRLFPVGKHFPSQFPHHQIKR